MILSFFYNIANEYAGYADSKVLFDVIAETTLGFN